ncbi:MAG: hypothetical protein Q4E16_03410 [Neisseria sp.]|nr:hypothetical protein [Neisseria sp.]
MMNIFSELREKANLSKAASPFYGGDYFLTANSLLNGIRDILKNKKNDEISLALHEIPLRIESYFKFQKDIAFEEVKHEMLDCTNEKHREYLASLFEWDNGACFPTDEVYFYYAEKEYLETEENTSKLEALKAYLFEFSDIQKDDSDEYFQDMQDYEWVAILALYFTDSALCIFSQEDFHSEDFNKFTSHKINWIKEQLLFAWQALHYATLLKNADKVEREALIQVENEARQKARAEMARKGGLAKLSHYQKAGTIDAVNQLLDEKKDLYNRRGGKSALVKMISDLIANGNISAPNMPSQKTIETWVNNHQKATSQQSFA